ncbi:MAG: GNAT family N-acetyltransferase [Anaerolinea sp.]|nr:GNAT family N-acetyltransferase [Anaerolinea sp.]
MMIRPYTPADLDALVEMLNRAYAGFGMEARTTPEILAHRIDVPLFEMTLMFDADGQMIAASGCDYEPDQGAAVGDINLIPEARTPDVIHALLAQIEAQAVARLEALAPPDTPLHLTVFFKSTADDILSAVAERGWTHVRSFYRMQTPLRDPVAVPPLPDGLTLRRFDRDRDTYAVYEANQAAFAEHWGRAEISYDEWQHLILNRPGDDNSMWLIAWDGDQIAGFCLNRPGGTHIPDLAWVGSLGVLKPYRKRGLGYALLKHSFKLFQERGFARAGLGVDGSNETGAVGLYERAGMSVYLQFLYYRKVLRGTI